MPMEARSRQFAEMCGRFLRAVNRPYPSASDRTVHGVVLDLGNLYTLRWIYEEFVRKSDPDLGEDDWAVVASNLIPGAPLDGTYVGFRRTTQKIANMVGNIYRDFVEPVCKYSHEVALQESLERKASIQATVLENSGPILVEATCQLPTPSGDSGNILSLSLASPSPASPPQTTSAAEVHPVPPAATAQPPVGLLDFNTAVVKQLYDAYLLSCGKSMPSEAERTVGGKVIDIVRLMAMAIGWRQQRHRLPNLSDWGGIAVAQFGFPVHTNVLSIADPGDCFAFATSDPDIARGLRDLYVRHLQDCPALQASWRAAWDSACVDTVQRLGCKLFSAEDIARVEYVHSRDLFDLMHARMLARAAPPANSDGSSDVSSSVPFRPGFSPLPEIRERVRERTRMDPDPHVPREPVRTLHVHSEEGQEWLRQWKEFASHRTQALLWLDHIHETLQQDGEIERILAMLAAHERIYRDVSDPRVGPLSGAGGRPSVAKQLGFPPRHLVNVETLRNWNAEFARIWADVHRLAKPGAVPQSRDYGGELLAPPRPAVSDVMHGSFGSPNSQQGSSSAPPCVAG